MLSKITGIISNLFQPAQAQTARVRFVESDSRHEFDVPPGETLLGAALDAGLEFPHSCRVGSCGRCRCKVEEGSVDLLADISLTLKRHRIDKDFVLACQSLVKSPIMVEVHPRVSGAK